MRNKVIIGWVISLIFLAVILLKFNYREFVASVLSCNYRLLPVIPAIIFVSYLLRALRWKIILQNIKNVSYWTSFDVIMIAYMANNVLPARLGELVRAYVLGIKEKVSKVSAFSSVIVERVFDGVSILLTLLVMLIVYPFPPWVYKMGWAGAILFVGAFGLVWLPAFYFRKKAVDASKIPFIGKFTFVTTILEKLVAGFRTMNNTLSMVAVFFLSLIIWGIEVSMYYTMFYIFHLKLPVIAAFFVVVTINFAIMLPSSPSALGVYHFACVKALEVFGVQYNAALAYATVIHAIYFLFLTTMGYISLLKIGMGFNAITHMEDPKSSETEKPMSEVANEPISE